MFKKFLLLFCLILLSYSLNAAKDGRWDYMPEVVAKVGSLNVSRQDFVDYLEIKLDPRALVNQNYVKKVAPEMLDGYINLLLLSQKANEMGFKSSAEKAGKELKRLYPKIDESQLVKLKNSKSMQMELARNEWVSNIIRPRMKISDVELKKAYNEYGIVIKASHILFRPNGNSPAKLLKARSRAEAALKKIKAGAPFEKIAATDNDCRTSANPGDLGEFGRGKMVPSFEKAAFKLEPGQVSDIVQSPFGFHIIKVRGKRQISLPPFDSVKEPLRQKLISIRAEDEIMSILKKQKKAIKVITYIK